MTTQPEPIPLLDGTPSLVGYGHGVVLIMRTDGQPGMVYRADDVTLLIDKLQIAQDAALQNVKTADDPLGAEPSAATSETTLEG